MDYLLEGVKALCTMDGLKCIVMYAIGIALIWLAIKKEYEPSSILNLDETYFLVSNPGLKSVTRVGTESVPFYIDNDPKLGMTILCTITKDCHKLPLLYIAKGKTKTCEKQYGEFIKENCYITHSPSGWTNIGIMKEYLYLISELFNHQPLALLLDQYGAHRNDEVKQLANELEIELVFIPKGTTSWLQPLDRKIFGQMKSTARSLWMSEHITKEDKKDTKVTGAVLAFKSWETISEESIRSAFDIDFDEVYLKNYISDFDEPTTDSFDPKIHEYL